MSFPLRVEDRHTWDDYRRLPDDERWELIGGKLHSMSPSPLDRHQMIVGELLAAFHAFLKGRECRVIVSPMDLKLSDEDVVQPDLMVVCDSKQYKGTHIEGAPSLVVEILSKSSEFSDRHRKKDLYERFGVMEYWIVSPFPQYIEIYRLLGGVFALQGAFDPGSKVVSGFFPGLEIDFDELFDFPVSDDDACALRFLRESRCESYSSAAPGVA